MKDPWFGSEVPMARNRKGLGNRDESNKTMSFISQSTGKELQKDINSYRRGPQPVLAETESLNNSSGVTPPGLGPDSLDEIGTSNAGSSAKTAVASLMLLSAFTKIFGFIREILLGRFYGIGDTAEAYKIAQTIPVMILMIIGTGLATGFIPTYNKTYATKGPKAASRFMSNTINISVIIGVVFCFIVALFPGVFVKLFASGFTGEKLQLTMNFTRIAVWGVIFSFMSYIIQPYLQINENFWVPAMVGIPMNLIFFLSFPAGKYLNESFLPIGIVVSVLVQVLWMIPFVRKQGYHWQPVIDTKDEDLRHLLMLAAPVLLGVAVNQINIIIDRTMASRVLDGGVAALDYATKMNGFVQGIFIYSVMTVVFPRISKLFIQKDHKAVEQLTTNAMVTMSLIVIPCIVGLMVFSTQIITLLFKGGAFDDQAVALTAGAMFFYAPGLIGFAFREILARVFYSMNDTKTPTFNAALAVGANIVLNILLSLVMGINGLALATSISALLGSILLMMALRRRGSLKLHYRELVYKLIRIGIASLVMGLVSWLSFQLLESLIGPKLGVILAIGVAIVVYGTVIIFMKIPEVEELLTMIKQRIRKK